MALEILMPALSPTMEEGTLAKWLVAEGDRVQSGDLLAEIETDKATMEFEAVDEGVIGKLLVAEGTANVKVNSAIAILLEEGDAADATVSPAQSAAAAAPLTHEANAVDAPAATAAPAAAISNDGTRIFCLASGASHCSRSRLRSGQDYRIWPQRADCESRCEWRPRPCLRFRAPANGRRPRRQLAQLRKRGSALSGAQL
eukprot:GHVR01017570.1.p3 GENE.GHVR01017570.1~~GHVR01017570.1.p3  ORF type:complete len:200 (-),score=40.20 GHVR01017570.1:855-1454(-)